MVSARPQFEAACQLQSLLVLVSWSSTVAVQRACTSPRSVRFTRPAPDSMAGLAEWLGAGLWLQSREFDSLISPQMGGSYKGITHGLQP